MTRKCLPCSLSSKDDSGVERADISLIARTRGGAGEDNITGSLVSGVQASSRGMSATLGSSEAPQLRTCKKEEPGHAGQKHRAVEENVGEFHESR